MANQSDFARRLLFFDRCCLISNILQDVLLQSSFALDKENINTLEKLKKAQDLIISAASDVGQIKYQ